MAIVTILGAGMMGSALALPLLDHGHEVRIVGTHLDDEIIASLRARGHHPTLAIDLPRGIKPFALGELSIALDGASLVALGVSSPGVAWAGRTLAPYACAGVDYVMIAKGLEWTGASLEILPDVFAREMPLGTSAPVAVAGPCIAGELARRVETCVVLASRDVDALSRVGGALAAPYYHVARSRDVVGVEACAALKNAYAMGVGFGAGVHERNGGAPGSVAMHNYEAATFAQASREMHRLVASLGGSPETTSGFAGVGDLNVTCNGGRTGRFGKWLGLGLSTEQAIAKMNGATLECIDILRTLRLALPWLERERGLAPHELPLLRHMQAVLFDRAPVAMPFDAFVREGTV